MPIVATRSGTPFLCLALTGTLVGALLTGCAPNQPAGWNGIYTIDAAGGARVCVAPTVSPSDGQTLVVPVQVSDEGGWCGIGALRAGKALDSYLLVARPAHGTVFAHHVGANTRIDYIPDTGYVGTDSFAVRLIPGDAVIQGSVTVVK